MRGYFYSPMGMPEAIKFAIDESARHFDADGRLHITRSHISKATVNPYYGREIPGCDALGLDPDRIYYLLRDPAELAKGAGTFARLQILKKHIAVNADEPQMDKVVGAIGSDVEFNEPYLDADVCIWDAEAIAGIETEQQAEFSCSYRYVPVMTTGNYRGQNYDGIMTQIQGNHLALVEAGRAGPDVRAADSKLENSPMKRSKLGNALIVALTTAFPNVKIAQDSELEKLLGNAKRKTFAKPERDKAAGLMLAMDSSLDAARIGVVMDALADVDDPEPKKKGNEDPESADDECNCGAKDGKHAKDCNMSQDEEPDADYPDGKKKAAKDGGKGLSCRDSEPATKKETKEAMDSLEKRLREGFREADEAKRDVRPVVGEVIAQDSAAEIYGFALDHMKVDRTGVEGVAGLRALYRAVRDRQAVEVPSHIAMDSAGAVKRFPHLGRFRQI